MPSAVVSAFTALIFFASFPLHAVPVYWDFTFTDLNLQEVGNGFIQYDDATTASFQNFRTSGPDMTVTTQLEEANFVVQGYDWYDDYVARGMPERVSFGTSTPNLSWWYDQQSGVGAGHTVQYLSGPNSVENRLHFGSSLGSIHASDSTYGFDTVDYFNIAVGVQGANSATGGWYQYINPEPETAGRGSGTPTDYTDTGFWTASLREISMPEIPVVPIPATLPLFGIGILGLAWVSRKRKNS